MVIPLLQSTGQYLRIQGGFSGQDPYNQPTKAIVNNPSLKYNGTFTINENCVIIKNDDMQQGLIHIFNKIRYFINRKKKSNHHVND